MIRLAVNLMKGPVFGELSRDLEIPVYNPLLEMNESYFFTLQFTLTLLNPSRPRLLALFGLGFHGSRHRRGLCGRGRIPGVRRLCHLHALLVSRRWRRRRLRVPGGRARAGAAALGVGGGAAAQVLLRLLQRRHSRHPSLRPLSG